MTTPQDTPKYVIAIDGIGVMAKVATSYAVRALLTGELVPTNQEGVYALGYTVPMNPLTGAQRRALELKKNGAHR